MNQIYIAAEPQVVAINNATLADSTLHIRQGTTGLYFTILMSPPGTLPATHSGADWRTSAAQRTAATAVLGAFENAGPPDDRHLYIFDDTTLADAMVARGLQRIPEPPPII